MLFKMLENGLLLYDCLCSFAAIFFIESDDDNDVTYKLRGAPLAG